MAAVEAVVPVLSVPLVAASILENESVGDLVARLHAVGAVLKLPPGGLAQAEAEGRAMLILRGVLTEAGALRPEMTEVLAFYAAPLLQRLGRGAVISAAQREISATPQT